MPIPIGVILSGATSIKASCQLYEKFENKVFEGEFCIVLRNDNTKILSRINKLIPYCEFLEEGDVWSEARRKEAPIPVELSRKYVIAELELLGEIKQGGLREVSMPPFPGDKVCMIESSEEIRRMIIPYKEEKAIVDFGNLLGYRDISLPLDLDAVPMHMAIIGVTGSGKSYTVGYLIEQLSNIEIGRKEKTTIKAFPIMVIDANGDYIDFYEEFHVRGNKIGEFYNVYRFVFHSSPVRLARGAVTLSMDMEVFEPREIAELVITYYSGGYLNELQVSGLELAIRRLYEEGYIISSLFINDRLFEKRLLGELKEMKKEGLIHDQTLKAIERALHKFKTDTIDQHMLFAYSKNTTLNDKLIDEITKKPSLVIIDFSADGAPGVSLQLKQLVVSYITKLLFNKFTEYKITGIERVLLLIIEEAQNYCPNLSVYPIGYSLARDNLAKIATQGRKFGLSLCLVSQRPSFVDPVILSMVNTFIIHRVSAEDVVFIRKIAGSLPKVIENKLVSLKTGRAIITGQMNILGFSAIVDIPKRKIKPKIGKIDVSAILSKT